MTSTTTRATRIGFGIFIAAALGFLFLPLALMILFAFNDAPRLSFPIHGVSLRWFGALADDDEFLDAFKRTIMVAVATAVGSGALALLGALGLVRFGPRVRAIALTLAGIPLAFPLLLYAIGLAFFYHQVGIGFSLWATIAGHVVLALPFSFLIIGAALERFEFSLLEAARDLGASSFHAFRTVTLPSILPAVIGSMLLAAALSADEFVIAFFTAGQNKTLPMLLYGRLNLGVTPALNAVGTVLLILTTALALFSARRTSRQESA
jgi:spermidine/putrescine transport system permease protein